uniref:Uncharacterized protein n=1 Tax=Physcomitrium patens TaxID=3218 RepID=A0A2K1IQR8_PHYPA|nr:hypothetical protein PHYPA_025746 [Physcomitrium patens]
MADSRQPLRENCHSRHGHFNNNDWEILNAALCNGALVEHQKLAALVSTGLPRHLTCIVRKEWIMGFFWRQDLVSDSSLFGQ